eukprot:CAMPEP_0172070342 /NCGR_PEP_ID=MMETSP1043-20130122/13214_1 /TAXON_ID=464988 /ORGANISM="Hemiselmis andersenii, Strain CCMP441" /LENGTH=173 /DNA_ID=CAMNT_0012730703 /DNA_START=73 /DNA_END=592 /DNA_ORIENTATION=-
MQTNQSMVTARSAQQTAATSALSDGLAWTNGHVVRYNVSSICPQLDGVPQELAGTATTCAAAVLLTVLARLGVTALAGAYARSRGREPPQLAAMIFPSWELTVAVVAFQGLSESAGVAVASGCGGYVVAGSITLALLALSLLAAAALLWKGVRGGLAVFEATDTGSKASELRE